METEKKPEPKKEKELASKNGNYSSAVMDSMFQSQARASEAMMGVAAKVMESSTSSFSFSWPQLPEVVDSLNTGEPMKSHTLDTVVNMYMQTYEMKLKNGHRCSCQGGNGRVPCCVAVVSYAIHAFALYAVDMKQEYSNSKSFSSVTVSMNVMNMVGIGLSSADAELDERARAILGIRRYSDKLVIPITSCVFGGSSHTMISMTLAERAKLAMSIESDLPEGVKRIEGYSCEQYQSDMERSLISQMQKSITEQWNCVLPQSWKFFFEEMVDGDEELLNTYLSNLKANKVSISWLNNKIVALKSAEEDERAIDPNNASGLFCRLVGAAGVTAPFQIDGVLDKLKIYVDTVREMKSSKM